MKNCSSREIIEQIKADGWCLANTVGSHHQFKHPTKPGRVTVKHPTRDMPPKTLKNIETQAGLRFK